ncbi:MAG TPA: sulfotransferase [Nocardioidaceae bacterium]|nr:sulfotransferase [Nocardioidaceae bacterium]
MTQLSSEPLPGVYLIGAPKAGTTSVAAWLAGHPDVHVSQPKEPFFWASDYPRMREHYGFADRETYSSLFRDDVADGRRHRVDASTTYLYSEQAVPDILEQVSDPRFLVCVRNPVDLLVSYHRTQVVALNEPEGDFARAWRRGRPAAGETSALDAKLLDYDTVGRQGAAVERVQRLAGPERVHVVVFDDLVADPRRVWDRLLGFLGLAPRPLPDVSQHNPSNKTARWKGLRRTLHRPPPAIAPAVRRLRQWARTTDSAAVGRVKDLLWKPTERPRIDDDLRRELEATFTDDVERLGRLLGRDLTGWTRGASAGPADTPAGAGVPRREVTS